MVDFAVSHVETPRMKVSAAQKVLRNDVDLAVSHLERSPLKLCAL